MSDKDVALLHSDAQAFIGPRTHKRGGFRPLGFYHLHAIPDPDMIYRFLPSSRDLSGTRDLAIIWGEALSKMNVFANITLSRHISLICITKTLLCSKQLHTPYCITKTHEPVKSVTWHLNRLRISRWRMPKQACKHKLLNGKRATRFYRLPQHFSTCRQLNCQPRNRDNVGMSYSDGHGRKCRGVGIVSPAVPFKCYFPSGFVSTFELRCRPMSVDVDSVGSLISGRHGRKCGAPSESLRQLFPLKSYFNFSFHFRFRDRHLSYDVGRCRAMSAVSYSGRAWSKNVGVAVGIALPALSVQKLFPLPVSWRHLRCRCHFPVRHGPKKCGCRESFRHCFRFPKLFLLGFSTSVSVATSEFLSSAYSAY